MVATKLKTRYKICGVLNGTPERIAMFALAETLATGTATIPADTTKIVVIADGAVHWHPTGTPTSTFGHAVAANEPFQLEHHQFDSAKIVSDAAADENAIVIYLR